MGDRRNVGHAPFGLRAQLAAAAAWSPNPNKPPLYLDLPTSGNEQAVLARWAANAPLAFVDQYIRPLRAYRGIAIDVGDMDTLKADETVVPFFSRTLSFETARR